MSTEEKEQLVGRLVLQQKEIGSELAFIDAELSDFADNLHELMGSVNRRVRYSGPNGIPPLVVSQKTAAYADLSKLSVLCQKQDDLVAKLSRVNELLRPLLG